MTWILTYTGKKFDPFNPHPGSIDIMDIAHALSNLCRFTGHCRLFYSVAQHSVLVSGIAPAQDRLTALLHDAPEAYLADLSTPVKSQMSDYQALENALWVAIASKFDLPLDMPVSVKHADRVLLATERRDLLPRHPEPWPCLHGIEPLPNTITPVDPLGAERIFLYTFMAICHARHCDVEAYA